MARYHLFLEFSDNMTARQIARQIGAGTVPATMAVVHFSADLDACNRAISLAKKRNGAHPMGGALESYELRSDDGALVDSNF